MQAEDRRLPSRQADQMELWNLRIDWWWKTIFLIPTLPTQWFWGFPCGSLQGSSCQLKVERFGARAEDRIRDEVNHGTAGGTAGGWVFCSLLQSEQGRY